MLISFVWISWLEELTALSFSASLNHAPIVQAILKFVRYLNYNQDEQFRVLNAMVDYEGVMERTTFRTFREHLEELVGQALSHATGLPDGISLHIARTIYRSADDRWKF